MKKTLALPVLASLLLVSCGGGTQAPEVSGTDSNLPEVTTSEFGEKDASLLDAGDIIAAEIESKKKNQEFAVEVKKADALLQEAGAMNFAEEQPAIKAKLEEVRAIAATLSEEDDFFLVAEELKSGADAVEAVLANFVVIDGLDVLVDLSPKLNGDTIVGLNRDGTDIYAIGRRAVYGPIQSGNPDSIKRIDLPEGVEAYDATYSIKFGALHVMTNPSRVFALGQDAFIEQSVEGGSTWRPAGAFVAYGSNLYAWDPIERRFLKYENTGSATYGAPSDALPASFFQDSIVLSSAIDGSIYTLDHEGRIRNFINGGEITTTIDRQYEIKGTDASIYTELGSNYLYLYDPAGDKLIRYRKGSDSLSVDKEYTIKGSYSHFFPASGDRKVYFLGGSSIYTLQL